MSRTVELAARVARELGAPGLHDALVELGGARLKSLLMHVARRRSRRRTAADLIRQARRDQTVEPSSADLRILHAIDGYALEATAGFDAVDLSMLQPVGTSTTLGSIDQNSVLATIAGTEVVADPTSALALEAAARRDGGDVVRLCTSQRVLRMQPFDNPSFTRHFRLFAAITAGRDRGAERFELEALHEHAALYLRLLARLAAAGFATRRVAIEVTDVRLTRRLAEIAEIDLDTLLRTEVRAHAQASYLERFAAGGVELPESIDGPEELSDLARRHDLDREQARLARIRREVFEPLAREHRAAHFGFAPLRLEGAGYYRGYCFRVRVEHPELGWLAPGDGGFVDWTARLRGDRKERMLSSGLGTELLAKLFAPGG